MRRQFNKAIIDPKAVTHYFDRDLNSYDWIKKCTHADLDEWLEDLDPTPQFFYKPQYFWQKAGFILSEELRQFFLIYEMGTGKTRLILDIIGYRKLCGEKPRAIVFVPYVSAVRTWVKECPLWQPGLHCEPLIGDGNEALALLQESNADLFVTTYQSAASFLSKPGQTKKGKNIWNLNTNLLKKVFQNFTIMVADESQFIANPDSLYYKILFNISKLTEDRFCLTGTPFGTDPKDVWSQFQVLDHGETLSPNKKASRPNDGFGWFKSMYCEDVIGWGGHTKPVFIPEKKKQLRMMMKNRSLRYREDECNELPKKYPIIKNIQFPNEMRNYHKAAVEEFRALIKNKKSENYSALQSSYVRLCQLSSGFMTFKGEEKNDRIKVQFKSNPKLDTLLEIVQTIPDPRKVVIFHNFVQTNHIISAGLDSIKVPHARVWGEQKHTIRELDRFEDDPECKAMVLNSKSGSTSLNLQHANYVVFFELPSLRDYKQAIKRVWRNGQKRRVFIFYLLMEGTHDHNQYNNLLRGEDFFKRVLDGTSHI